MRTREEIVKKLSGKMDFFGFQATILIGYLDYDHAKEFLKGGTTKAEWAECVSENTKECILKEMKGYMSFAWEKANNFRGISAARSMYKYQAWIWLLGDNYEEKFGDLSDYEYYGKDHLVAICKEFGWNYEKWDDGVRENSES